jgi:hypothetical protein
MSNGDSMIIEQQPREPRLSRVVRHSDGPHRGADRAGRDARTAWSPSRDPPYRKRLASSHASPDASITLGVERLNAASKSSDCSCRFGEFLLATLRATKVDLRPAAFGPQDKGVVLRSQVMLGPVTETPWLVVRTVLAQKRASLKRRTRSRPSRRLARTPTRSLVLFNAVRGRGHASRSGAVKLIRNLQPK